MGRRVITLNEFDKLWRRDSLRHLYHRESEKFASIRDSDIEVLSTFELLKEIIYKPYLE